MSEVDTYQKRPTVKAIPPTITGGNRHSGTGISLLAINFFVYAD